MDDLLEIQTLGGLFVRQSGQILADFGSRKVQALLVYLACTGRKHPRELLADLLWDDLPQERALANLRVVLSHLRKHLTPYLQISREHVAIDPDANIWLDASELEKGLRSVDDFKERHSPSFTSHIDQVLKLYIGDFLAGFSVRGCRNFQEWVVRERERLHRLVVDALNEVVNYDTGIGDFGAGISHVTRLLEIEPLMEAAHRNLMRLLYYNGQRAAAMEQYEVCRQILKKELDIEPATETLLIFRQIQDGTLQEKFRKKSESPASAPVITRKIPEFLTLNESERVTKPRRFVARERELTRLDEYLELASKGEGRLVFITGEAGSGKTALMEAFGRKATQDYPDLLVAIGNCNAYSGVGDPYLPFRDLLRMLMGDLESKVGSGTISIESARRIWETIPITIQAFKENSLDQAGFFTLNKKFQNLMMEKADHSSAQPSPMVAVAEQDAVPIIDFDRSGLFGQFSQGLHKISKERILVLMLDDLQWIDHASANLLFHLGRRLQGEKILILGAYRGDEVYNDPSNGGHPLLKLLSEFKRQYGDVWIDLDEIDQSSGQKFVNSYLDSEPNRFRESFRRSLWERTGGHPLFTIELLRELEARRDVVKDRKGFWIEGKQVHWERIPFKVEGVIEERIQRLNQDLQLILNIAAVAGSSFSAQVIAQVTDQDENLLIHQISQELVHKFKLVEEEGVFKINSQKLFQYRFRHYLIQQYLYKRMGGLERRLFHAEIATILEAIYGEHIEEINVLLANHWVLAGEMVKALPYLLGAGDRARLLYAHEEAEGFYQQAVEILRKLNREEELAKTLMKLGLVYSASFQGEKASQAYNQSFAILEMLRSSKELQQAKAQGEVLHFAVEAPFTLDPGLINDDVSTFLAKQLFEGLVWLDLDNNILPAVASHWSISEDGLGYEFTLRKDYHWSDGTPLSAGDFEFAWKRNLAPATGSSAATLLYPILNASAYAEGRIENADAVGIKALDELTLEVKLEQPTAYLLSLLIHPVTFPLPRHLVQVHGEQWSDPTHLVGNGAFRLVEWEKRQRIILERNPHYRGRFPGNLGRVVSPIISDFAEVLDAYSNDDLDAVSMITADPGTVGRAKILFRDELVFIPQPSTFYLFLRGDLHPFDNPLVRKAFSHALDRYGLREDAFPVNAQFLPATGGFVPPGMPGYSPDAGLIFDPDFARDLLSKAGYPGGKGLPNLTLYYSGGSIYERVVPFLRSAWRKHLGVEIVAYSLEWREFMRRMEDDPGHLTLLGWSADYFDPDIMLRFLFHTKEGFYHDRWHNPRFDTLVESAARINDQNQRIELYQQADRILVAEEAVVIPLGHPQARILLKPRVVFPWIRPVQMCLKNFIVERRLSEIK
jgi:ABC-type oligopeptide transport system substrate-binding subunit/DNA-binding SARP family transcriptional activator